MNDKFVIVRECLIISIHTDAMMIMNQVIAMRTGALVRAGRVNTRALTKLRMGVIGMSKSTISDLVDNIALMTFIDILTSEGVHKTITAIALAFVRAKRIDALLFTQILSVFALVNVNTVLTTGVRLTEAGFTATL